MLEDVANHAWNQGAYRALNKTPIENIAAKHGYTIKE